MLSTGWDVKLQIRKFQKLHQSPTDILSNKEIIDYLQKILAISHFSPIFNPLQQEFVLNQCRKINTSTIYIQGKNSVIHYNALSVFGMCV